MNKSRRNAITLDLDDEISQTSELTPAKTTSAKPTSQTSSRKPSLQTHSNSTTSSDHTPRGEEHYIRIGRRTAEDDKDNDIPTHCLVVARIEEEREKVVWLAVPTWQLNGLRIGTATTGDPIREDAYFNLSTSLDPDPYFFARNLLSPARLRRHLLELVGEQRLDVQAETLDDEVAEQERDQAQWGRLAKDTGAVKDRDGDGCALAGQEVEERFPHPWALPVALSRSTVQFPGGLGAFGDHGGGKENVHIPSINVIAIFANGINEHDLRLPNYVQVEFEADETLEQAKQYFRLGEPDGGFQGLEGSRLLGHGRWMLEIWVLPQLRGCSTLFRWDDVSGLPARVFCDLQTLMEEADGKAKLYVEVRIVRNPDVDEEMLGGGDDMSDWDPY